MDKETELHGRLRVVEEWMEATEKRLFGNGQPGAIENIERRIEKVTKEIRSDNARLVKIALIILATISALTGSGTVSLHSLVGWLK